jgi:tetratricopeptide (TPR) repeat protein
MTLQMAARASLGQRDIDGALEFLQRSVAERPDNIDSRFQLAATLLQVGRTDEAQAVIDKIDLSGSTENAYRRDALGVLIAMRDQETAFALQYAKLVVDTYPDRTGAFNLQGAVMLANKDIDGAKVSFEQAVALQPSDVVSRRYLAAIAESEGDLVLAKSHYQSILTDEPGEAWAMFALGRISFLQEDYAGAVSNFNRASDAAPDNANYRLNLAKAESQLGNNTRAADILAEDFESSLDHIPSAVLLATVKTKEGDLDGALDIAHKLQQRHPKDPAVYALEGEINIAGEDLLRADRNYDRAVSLGPTRSHALRSYQIKRDLGVGRAEQPLIDFLAIRPLDTGVRVVLAEFYAQSDDLAKSIITYERALSDEPNNAIALNNLAWIYFMTADARAIDTAQQAANKMPENAAIIDTLGWIMVHQGSVSDGERLLRDAVELGDGRAEFRYHHAVALAKLAKTDEARSILDEILAGDDEFASRDDAIKLLAEL